MTIVDIVINYFTELASTGIRSLIVGFVIAALVILLWPAPRK
ncbi:hypothetical protein NP1_50 [Xanthomonas phage NP1]|nr:hypothetical protein NP1_50 [Xanthomonas phage NP1]